MLPLLIRYLAFHKMRAVLIENVLVVLCVLIDGIEIPTQGAPLQHYAMWIAKGFVMAILFQVSLHFWDAYDFGVEATTFQFLIRFVKALAMGSVLVCLPYFLLNLWPLEYSVLLRILLRISVFLTVWHILLRIYFTHHSRRSNVLIMGTGALARALASEIVRHPQLGLYVCGFVDDDPALVGVSIVNPKVIGLTRDLHHIVSEIKVERVVVELGDRRGRLPTDALLALKMRGVGIEEATSLYERVTGKIAVENLKPRWMIFNEGFNVSRVTLFQKQIISVVASLILLLLFLPLLPFILLLIKLDSGGPILFSQDRVGQNGKIFTLWKFRSMRQNAERDSGPVWSTAKDSRVTRVGRFLRRTRLDEIPQLYNVLKGDMTLVGPRPERPHFVNQLSEQIPYYHLRHSVKPGLTGWAQINYRYGQSVEDSLEKLQYDLFYVKHISWLLDSVILIDTIKTVMVRKGS